MRILFLFTLVTLISSDFLFSQEKSTIIQTINDRELKSLELEYIDKLEDAAPSEGGSGCTIAWIK